MLKKIFHTSSLILDMRMSYRFVPDKAKPVWIKTRIQQLGPTYIKLGQFMSNRSDILGDNKFLKEALVKLHDEVDPLSWDIAYDVISANTDISQFEDIHPVPIASASIGQVHRGTLKTGEEVVIKLRRPNILADINDDVAILNLVLGILLFFAPESKKNHFTEAFKMVNDMKTSIEKESVFSDELANMVAFQTLKLKGVQIPVPYPLLSNDRILVMQYVPSIKFAHAYVADPDKRRLLAFEIMDCFVKQLLFHGIVHGDPHPGNYALSTSKDKFIMYDFGSIVRVDARTQTYFKLLVFELLNDNVKGVLNLLKEVPELIIIKDETTLKTYIKSYIKYIKTIDINVLKEIANDRTVDQDLPVKFANKVFEIVRVFGIIEGICIDLDPLFSYEEVFNKYADVLFNDSDFLILKSCQDFNSLIDML